MAIHHAAVTVGTTATLLVTIPAKVDYTAVTIFNDDNSAIYIGDSTVSTSGANLGIKISKSTTTSQIWLNAGDSLYAISAAGTAANAVGVLYSGAF